PCLAELLHHPGGAASGVGLPLPFYRLPASDDHFSFRFRWSRSRVGGKPFGAHVLRPPPRRDMETPLLQALPRRLRHDGHDLVHPVLRPDEDGRQGLEHLTVALRGPRDLELRPEVHVHQQPLAAADDHIDVLILSYGCIVAEGSKACGHSFDGVLFSLAIPGLLHEVDLEDLGYLNGLRGVPGVGGCDGGFCSEVVVGRVASVAAFPLHIVPDHPVERNGARLQVGPGIESLLRRDPGHAGELPLEEALQHRLARRLRLIASDHPFLIDRLASFLLPLPISNCNLQSIKKRQKWRYRRSNRTANDRGRKHNDRESFDSYTRQARLLPVSFDKHGIASDSRTKRIGEGFMRERERERGKKSESYRDGLVRGDRSVEPWITRRQRWRSEERSLEAEEAAVGVLKEGGGEWRSRS
ncbi:hypothetical protein BHM03_00041566, partial [Ensete ventricosum]